MTGMYSTLVLLCVPIRLSNVFASPSIRMIQGVAEQKNASDRISIVFFGGQFCGPGLRSLVHWDCVRWSCRTLWQRVVTLRDAVHYFASRIACRAYLPEKKQVPERSFSQIGPVHTILVDAAND